MALRGPDAPTRAATVAVLADVHGNAQALEAVSQELRGLRVDAVVFLGDITYGPLPEETWAVAGVIGGELCGWAHVVRGNGERVMAEGVRAAADDLTERDRWIIAAHATDTLQALAELGREHLVLNVGSLGPVRFCHGSPRCAEEMVTSATPAQRMIDMMVDVDERVLITAHTHIQFDRKVAGTRSINPGSVGLPYEGRPGAYWALLGAEVELRRTDYDVAAAAARIRRTRAPFADAYVEMLLTPPTRELVIAHAEALVYST